MAMTSGGGRHSVTLAALMTALSQMPGPALSGDPQRSEPQPRTAYAVVGD